MSTAERTVLERVGAGVGVRLACQLRPIRDIAFAPMLPAHTTVAEVNRSWPAGAGDERYLVIRRSTSEQASPPMIWRRTRSRSAAETSSSRLEPADLAIFAAAQATAAL